MSAEKSRILAVSGSGKEKIAATLANANLSVVTQGETATEVQQQAAIASSAVVEMLRANSVEKLKTAGLQLNRYERSNGKITKYSCSNTITFQVPIDSVGSLLDEAVRVGASRVNGVSFIAKETAIAQAKAEALKAATNDAKAKAEAVLDSLGFAIEEITRIEIDNARVDNTLHQSGSHRYETAESYREPVKGDAQTPVVDGELTVSASVALQISY